MKQTITFQVSYIELALVLLFVGLLVALCFAIPAFGRVKDAEESVEELQKEQRDIEKRLTALEAKKDEEEKKAHE